jgi:translocon-associated protein subunit alpha
MRSLPVLLFSRAIVILKFINSGTGNYTIVNAAASYHDVEKNWALVRNTTALKYNVPLPAGSNFSVPFNVHSE